MFLPERESTDPVAICQNGVAFGQREGCDVILFDTAGRLHIDDEMMNELKRIQNNVNPHEILLVADGMTGQDAVKSAQQFEEKIGLTSIILTKLDGDARGGAALSIVSVTGKPIKFVGVGEKFDKFEVFHPDRMASRIMGMGDVLSLIEKAEQETDIKEAEELASRLKSEEFSLEDFRKQLGQLKKMGSMSQFLNMLPTGGVFKQMSKMDIDDKRILYFEAIINSMTTKERENPKLINGSRRKRIAKGSGRPVSEVNQLLKQYFEMKKMMKKSQFKKMLSSMPMGH